MDMKAPDECTSLEEVRGEIDRLDRQVIALLGQRFAYVKAAAKFQTSEARVRAAERCGAMLRERRRWGEEAGLSADVIELMYRDLVTYFMEEELKHWKAAVPPVPPQP